MLCMKFGGTSVGDAAAFKNVIKIIKSYETKIIVVLSACAGVTDKLTTIVKNAPYTTKYDFEIENIKKIHKSIVSGLDLNSNTVDIINEKIDVLLNELCDITESVRTLGECTAKTLAKALSIGERLSTRILHNSLSDNQVGNTLIDSSNFIKTDDNWLNATWADDKKEINELREKLNNHQSKTLIAAGFIGNYQGHTTTLGRGGSDLSAAIFARITNASKLIIWKDVKGLLTADPRVANNARLIKEISYENMRLLAAFGAKLLHPEAIIPAIENNIPVEIRNTFAFKSPGTKILKDTNDKSTSIVLIENVYKIENIPTIEYLFLCKYVSTKSIIIHYESVVATIKTVIFEIKDSDLKDIILKEMTAYRNFSMIAIIGNVKEIKIQYYNSLIDSNQNFKILCVEKNKAIGVYKKLHELI